MFSGRRGTTRVAHRFNVQLPSPPAGRPGVSGDPSSAYCPSDPGWRYHRGWRRRASRRSRWGARFRSSAFSSWSRHPNGPACVVHVSREVGVILSGRNAVTTPAIVERGDVRLSALALPPRCSRRSGRSRAGGTPSLGGRAARRFGGTCRLHLAAFASSVASSPP